MDKIIRSMFKRTAASPSAYEQQTLAFPAYEQPGAIIPQQHGQVDEADVVGQVMETSDGRGGEENDDSAASRYDDAEGDDADDVMDASMDRYIDQESIAQSAEAQGAEETDLFQQAFGNATRTAVDDDDNDDDVQIIHAATITNKKRKRGATDYSHNPTEHAQACHPDRPVSTPPLEGPPPPKEANMVRDIRKSLKLQHRFHLKAKTFRPRLDLPKHRYWIAILHLDKRPNAATSEKHFTWIKGNRMTTIQTVWETYSTTALVTNFVLLLGHEKVHFKDRCEELDYFNDKFICLRAVKEDAPEAEGKELSEGCPPDVVEIDDD